MFYDAAMGAAPPSCGFAGPDLYCRVSLPDDPQARGRRVVAAGSCRSSSPTTTPAVPRTVRPRRLNLLIERSRRDAHGLRGVLPRLPHPRDHPAPSDLALVASRVP